jgi:hypothetical protein
MAVSSTVETAVDYDVHGLVGVRLLGAGLARRPPSTASSGPSRRGLDREPEITVRFVDRLDLHGPLRLIGLEDAAYTDDAFLVLRSKHKAQARVKYDVSQLGGRCEIVCERGLPGRPAARRHHQPDRAERRRAAAARVGLRGRRARRRDDGLVQGRQDEAMLTFVSRGARFVGDEWIYVEGTGDRVHGLPEPIRLWDWHLAQLPEVRAKAGHGRDGPPARPAGRRRRRDGARPPARRAREGRHARDARLEPRQGASSTSTPRPSGSSAPRRSRSPARSTGSSS